MPDKTACTPLPVTPLAFRLRGAEKEAMWLLDQADRKAGKQSGRGPRDHLPNLPRREKESSLLTYLPRCPSPFLSYSFLTYPTPFLALGPRTSPSILHAATNTEAGAKKPKDVPRLSSEKVRWTQRTDGRDADGEQRNGVQEGGIRAGGNSALAGSEAYLSPFQRSSTVSERKKTKLFWLLGRYRPPSSQARGQVGEGCTCKRQALRPGASDTEAAATVNDQ